MTAQPGPLLRLLRVPLEPAPPAGSPESVLVFRAARGFWRYRASRWLLAQVIALFYVFMQASALLATSDSVGDGAALAGVIFQGSLAALALLQVPLSFILMRIDYRMRWYVVTDRSLRIREGAWTVREMTMTFANIQNIEVTQGPLQRLFGIADLRVQSAGGGGAGSSKGDEGSSSGMHVGWFRGIDNAAEVRDLMRQRLRHYRGSGLGDLDDHGHAARSVPGRDRSPSLPAELHEGLSGIHRAAERLRAAAAAAELPKRAPH